LDIQHNPKDGTARYVEAVLFVTPGCDGRGTVTHRYPVVLMDKEPTRAG
jgi:hypothetical protein